MKRAPGKFVDTNLKYRAKLTFNGGDPAYVKLSVKSGTAKVTVSGTPVLYKQDRFRIDTFILTTKDSTLNELYSVEFKNPAHAEIFELGPGLNGDFAILFRNGTLPSGKIPTSIPINVFCESSNKPVATVTLKIQIR